MFSINQVPNKGGIMLTFSLVLNIVLFMESIKYCSELSFKGNKGQYGERNISVVISERNHVYKHHRTFNKKNVETISHIEVLTGNRSHRQNLAGINRANLVYIKTKNSTLNSRLKIATASLQSLCNKYDSVRHIISESDFDFLAITESWLSESHNYEALEACPPDYAILREDRGARGGGVATIGKCEQNQTKLTSDKYKSFEHLVSSVKYGFFNFNMITIYRPPKLSLSKFLDEFSSLLEEYAISSTPVIITGDLNIPWDKITDTYTQQLRELLLAFNLHQHISEATHSKGHILDYIITRNCDSFDICDIVIGDLLSDHHIISCYVELKVPKVQSKKKVSYRKYQSINMDAFKKDILDSSVFTDLETQSLDDLVVTFDNELRSILDKHAPTITRNCKPVEKDPWITQDVNDALRINRKAERIYRKNKQDAQKKAMFVDSRKEYDRKLFQSKTEYLSQFISKNKKDQKQVFRSVNKLMNKKKMNPMPEHVCELQLATDFCDFFQTKIENIRKDFPNNPASHAMEYDGHDTTLKPFTEFDPLSDEDVLRLINKSNDKFCELDAIPTSLLKSCSTELVPVIKRIINTSLQQGHFPSKYKSAVVKPL